MSNSGLFSIARSALLTHQTSLAVIGQNIANAETPGYSRQRTELQATNPVRFSYGSVGTGVTITTISRARDVLLDDSFRAANGNASSAEMKRNQVGQLEGVFGEPSDSGLTNALDEFWGAWSDLAGSPADAAAKAVVQQRGRQVAGLFNQFDRQLTDQRTSTLKNIKNTIAEINGTASAIARLNGDIVNAEAGGNSANDLRDQRDVKIDQLSKVAGVRVIPHIDGSMSIVMGNSTLVDGTSARPLRVELVPPVPAPAVTPADVPIKITLGNSPDPLYPLGGEIKALVDYVNTEIPGARNRLNALASALVASINTEHRQNFTFTGNAIPGTAAGNFFDAGTVLDPVRANTIKLDAAIEASATLISASRDANAPTSNAGAIALAALRSNTTSVSYLDSPSSPPETGSFNSFFSSFTAGIGVSVRGATDDAMVFRGLADQLDKRRQSVSGVNTDEELTNMMRVQQSYVAASKLIKVMDEMMQTLLQMT